MSKWVNPEEWQRLRISEFCPVCQNGKPLGIVAELEASYLTSVEDAPMKGYCCLVLKRHAIEIHDLTTEEAAALMRDIQTTSKAVAEITQPIKMNYEIHGNSIPHLHVHFFPRYVGDPFENAPVNPRIISKPVYMAGEFAEFVKQLQKAIASITTSMKTHKDA